MSTKNLSRSIIECGRGGYSRFERKLRAQSKRRWKLVDGEYEPAELKGEGRQLSDKLRPLERWLKAQAGRSWSKVYSEFCTDNDKRSLRGQHINEHLLDMVRRAGGKTGFDGYNELWQPPCHAKHGYWRFWLDDQLILRHHAPKDCESYGKKVGWARWDKRAENVTYPAPRLAIKPSKPPLTEELFRQLLKDRELADQANQVDAPA